MLHRRALTKAVAAGTAVLTVASLGVGAASGSSQTATHHRHSHHAHRAHHHDAATWRQRTRHHVRSHFRHVLLPPKKYYGVYASQAPASMAPVDRIAQETGKYPNLSLFYRAWDNAAAHGRSNIPVAAIRNACDAGMLPMMTWESWDTANGDSDGPKWSQPAFAPSLIAHGRYDAYVKASAETIESLPCSIAIRLDQEDNSYWYPWAIATRGMHNSAADYVAMWRHVWSIFNKVGAKNVVWVWSPNLQSRQHAGLPSLHASYPGGRYVDWVGIDGYIYGNPRLTFHQRFQPTFDQLRKFVPNTPWIIAECGVGDAASKPRQLRNLVRAVARRKRLTGFNYFDANKSSSAANWRFEDSQASLDAFRRAINSTDYAAARNGR